MSEHPKQSSINLKKYNRIFMLLLVAFNQNALAEYANGQIGNSYFKGGQTKTISQMGSAIEGYKNYSDFFIFTNKLFTNHLYYELRASSVYHYLSRNSPSSPLVPNIIPTSSERNPIGYGGVAIFGYHMNINSNLSFMPFIRLQCLKNTFLAYSDSYGNEINSTNYTAYLGWKLSLRVTDTFAIYTQYFNGYQRSLLSGRGLFATQTQPQTTNSQSIIEIGTPYKLTKSFSLTPYIQLITLGVDPNQAAHDKPYGLNQKTNDSNAYAIKISYAF